MIDLDNTVLKSIVTTLQSKVDDLEAKNKSLREGPWRGLPEAGATPTTYSAADNTTLHRGRPLVLTGANFSKIAFFLKHSNDQLWKEHDKLVEENKKLLKDNTKLATKVRKIEAGHFDEYFTYTTPPVQLPPLGAATTTIAITREADFYITKIVRESDGPFDYLVHDSSNDRQWSNLPLHSNLGAGTAEHPLILPKPRFVARASTITIEVTDLSMATNGVRLAFIGYKSYPAESLYHATGKEKKTGLGKVNRSDWDCVIEAGYRNDWDGVIEAGYADLPGPPGL